VLKYLVCLAFASLAGAESLACGGVSAAIMKSTVVVRERERVRPVRAILVRPVAAVQSFPTPMPSIRVAPVVRPRVVPLLPAPTPSKSPFVFAAPTDLEGRVRELEKAMDAAGRSLLFRGANGGGK